MAKHRLEGVRNKLGKWGVEGLLITNIDNIRYLSGFTGSTAIIVMTAQRALFLADGRYITQTQEEVKGLELKGYQGKQLDFIIEIIKDLEIKKLGFESETIVYSSFNKLREALEKDGVQLVPVNRAIEEFRIRKEEGEVRIIEKAINLAARALEAIKGSIRPGVREWDLAIDLEYQMKKLGAENIPFETIVVSGERSALPHGKPSEKVLMPGELVTIDWGCTVNGYHADITRTFALSGATPEQETKHKEIYQLVLEAQQKAIEAVKPGINSVDLDGCCRTIIKDAGYEEYFSHGTGHGVGIAVHEDPAITRYDGSIIEEGMVFTIEPGIYIPSWGGVRIEDMVWVKDGKSQVLTRAINKDWQALG
jgi:Xaa-Pro aminopeptidase